MRKHPLPNYTACPANEGYEPIGRHTQVANGAVAVVIGCDKFGPVVHYPAGTQLPVGTQLYVHPPEAIA